MRGFLLITASAFTGIFVGYITFLLGLSSLIAVAIGAAAGGIALGVPPMLLRTTSVFIGVLVGYITYLLGLSSLIAVAIGAAVGSIALMVLQKPAVKRYMSEPYA